MKLNKIFKWGLVVLILISVALLVFGFVKGFETNDAKAVDALLGWAYIMIGLALFAWIVLGLVISILNDPKSLIKMGIVLVGIAAVCLVAFLLAKGNPAVGYTGAPVSAGMLKLTDTVLTLTAIAGVGAIVAIVVGEIRLAITNRK